MSRPLPRLAAWLLRVSVPEQWADTVLGDLEADWHARLARGSRAAATETLADAACIAVRFAAERTRLGVAGTDRDAREAVRALIRRPPFTLSAVATLGVGVGVNIAAFAIVDRVVMQPLPYPAPGALVEIRGRALDSPASREEPVVSSVDVEAWGDALSDLVAIAAYQIEVVRVRPPGESVPMPMTAAHVTPNLFAVLGVAPAVGRGFLADEGRLGSDGVAVVATHVWQARFGARPDLLGRSLDVNGRAYTVVGVAPPGLEFPPGVGLWLARQTSGAALRGIEIEFASLRAIGRVKHNDMPAAVDAISQRGAVLARESGRPMSPVALPLHEAVVGDVRPALHLGWVAVTLLQLIACANAATLLSIRTASREREFALRASLGASRAAVVRLVAVEASLLAGAGLAAGVALAAVALRVFEAAEQGLVPRLAGVGVSWTSVAYGAALAMAAVVVMAVAPLTRRRAGGGVVGTGRPGFIGSDLGGYRGGAPFVAVQLAVSVVLLITATVTGWGVARLLLDDPGFDSSGVIALAIRPDAAHAGAPQHGAVYAPLLERLAAIDGVESVAMSDHLPPDAGGLEASILLEGQTADTDGTPVHTFGVTRRYFDVMRIPLLLGRSFTDAEVASGAAVAIVDTLVASRVGATDVVGRRIVMHGRVLEVVGVAAPARHGALDAAPRPTVYRPMPTGAYGARGVTFLTNAYAIARVKGNPAEVAVAVGSAASAPPLTARALGLATLDDRLWASLARPRFHAVVFGLFAVVGAVVAAMGVYGLVSFVVQVVTPEIAIRLALGAPRGRLVRDVLGRSLVHAGLGVAAGLAAAPAAAAAVAHRLDGVAPATAGLYSVVGGTLILVVVAASALPAWRATRINPVVTLKGGD